MKATLSLYLVLISFVLFAQKNCISVHGSILSVLGETTGGSTIGDDFGFGLNMRFSAPFILKNLEINAELSYYTVDIDYTYAGTIISFNHAKASQFNGSAGLTLYLFQKGSRSTMYKPYRLYISGYAGISTHTNEIIESHNVSDSFTLFEGLTIFPFGDLISGIKIRINPNNSVDIFMGGRLTLSDAVDAIAGTGKAPDLLWRVGVGICHAL
jgi:hypothetical protein